MVQDLKKLKEAKIFGGIGAILILLVAAPQMGWILALIGLILLLMAVKKISDAVEKKEIFRDFIKAVIFNGIAIVGFFLVGILIGIMAATEFKWTKLGMGALLGLLITWLFYVFGAYFQKRSFMKITEETGEGLFKIAGNLLFIGAILIIILVGLVIEFVGSIVRIIAFFSLPEELSKKL